MNLSLPLFSVGAAGGPFLITLVYHIKFDLSLSTIIGAATVPPVLLMTAFLFLGKKGPADTLPPFQISAMFLEHEFWVLIAPIFLYVAVEMGTAGWFVKYEALHLNLGDNLAPICVTILRAGLGLSRGFLGFMYRGKSDRNLLSLILLFTFILQVLSFLLRDIIPSQMDCRPFG